MGRPKAYCPLLGEIRTSIESAQGWALTIGNVNANFYIKRAGKKHARFAQDAAE